MTDRSALWMTRRGRSLIHEVDRLLSECGEGSDLDVLVMAARSRDARTLAAWRMSGRIGRLRVVLGSGMLNLRRASATAESRNPTDIESALGAESIRALLIHAKAVAARGPNGHAALLTSANLNRNNRSEQYERIDHWAGSLGGIMDRVFVSMTGGCEKRSGDELRQGLKAALRGAEGGGVLVHTASADMPAESLNLQDQLIVMRRAGLPALLPSVMARVGTPAEMRVVTWGVKRRIAFDLARYIEAGDISSLQVLVPARFGRRKERAADYAGMLISLGEHVAWSPSHAKIAIVRGPNNVAVITGSANLEPEGLLELIRVRFGDEGLAGIADGYMASAPREPAPAVPGEDALAKARNAYERHMAGGRMLRHAGTTPSARLDEGASFERALRRVDDGEISLRLGDE